MTQIDPDAEKPEAGERSKGFGEHMKDAAHDLKEDLKDVARRDKGDDDDEGEGGASDEKDGVSKDEDRRASE